ncbi:Holliday junction resolvase RusA-like endonuclease [Homoserinimonas aerilata]|uniref:Holliday junction resolvase RusA-like endonuclease n=1 Tax=Homoserinimonas aerilata TaxID=1162970 RepID=A0A542YF51_9MICO|nr:RusA family crossover junction endodeoxyribonuclease [Homoserinimonas aerilata]TQL46700.1 Holliday junction resolvase RusA-like endonuclease [Homoserinimonas aerilata]
MTGYTPYVAAMPEYFEAAVDAVAFQVDGTPAPQGSKKGFSRIGSTRVAMVESSDKVKPWRAAVKTAGEDAMNGRAPLDGPLTVLITFRLAKPKTVKRDLPTVYPDLDKLVRSTFDGLTAAGVIADDARICDLHTYKRYGEPGADITVICTPDVEAVAA